MCSLCFPLQCTRYDFHFTGQYYDQETGLHQNMFRDYDPE